MRPRPTKKSGLRFPPLWRFWGWRSCVARCWSTGLPPLSGFMAKFAMLSAAIGLCTAWRFIGPNLGARRHLLVAGLAGIIALTRIGMRLFWSVTGRTTPRLRIIEAAPVAFLLVLCIGLTVAAGPVMKYLDATAQALHTPRTYIDAVLPPPA